MKFISTKICIFCLLYTICIKTSFAITKNTTKSEEIKVEDLIIEEEKLPLKLVNLIYIALERNIDTKSAYIDIKLAENKLTNSKSVYYPSIYLDGNINRYDSDSYTKAEETATHGVNFSYNVFSFGRDYYKVKALEHYLNSVKYKKDLVVQDVIYTVAENYYYLLSLKAQKEAIIENENLSHEAFKAASLKYKIGLVPLVDKLKANNAYSKNKLDRIKLENDIKKQKANLNFLLNLEPNYVLYVEKPEINIKKVNKDVNYYINEAKKNRFDLKQLKEEKENRIKSLNSIRASMLPTVTAKGGIVGKDYLNVKDRFGNKIDTIYSNSIYLEVSMPIFSGFSTISSINSIKNEIKSFDLKIQQLEKSISNEVWNVFHDFDTNQVSYFISKDLLKTANENAKVTLGMYKNGKASMLDVLNSQNQLKLAKSEFIKSKYNLLIYRMKLLKTIGKMNIENIINIDNL